MEKHRAKIIGIARHRLSTDGDGVTTLVAFHGCPLHCRYCLNPQSLGDDSRFREYSPGQLYAETRIDELYFIATIGGITFGGGEPCLRPQFIREFRELCGPAWQLNLETSLNVPTANIEALLPVVNTLIIDIKDMNPDIYRDYAGQSNTLVVDNLRLIAETGRQSDCIVRIPLISGHNTDSDREKSRNVLEALGFSRFDLFTYQIRKHLHYGTRETNLQDIERDTSADCRSERH
ncbi:MAG: radical SAM protein [Muribaculaceae bacterium]|nr:radical SAM protein [Muribaculaceae bacterium]